MKLFANRSFAALVLSAAFAAAAFAQTTTRYMGSLTALEAGQIAIKTAQGEEHNVAVPSSAEVKRIEPGQTNLNLAVAMPFSELAIGDRVLVWIDPAAPADKPQAVRIVAIKAADLAQKHLQEAAEWTINGVGGLVKSVDPATASIVVTSGAGATAKTVTVHTAKDTVLKRYAANSTNYEHAQPGPFSAIQPGDQFMARGQKSADGVEFTAKEVVSGSFKNVSGLIASLDPDHQSFTIKDLVTKKTLTVVVPADAQMKLVPANVAQMLVARLKTTAAPAQQPQGAPAQQGVQQSGAPAQNGSAQGANSGGQARNQQGGAPQQGASAPAQGANGTWQGRSQQGGAPGAPAGGANGAWQGRAPQGGANSNDPQQMLTRLPAIHFADLTKGQAVMLVSSPGDSQVTAITLLAGVEALLEAPASQNLLANWSMGGGGEGGE